MKTRNHDWFDTKTLEPKFGLQIFVDGAWKNLAEDSVPCIYDTTAERDAKRAEYRKLTSLTAKPGAEGEK